MGTDPDPFEAFGGEEDAKNGVQSDQELKVNEPAIAPIRDPDNGVLTHHDGTEQALLQFVLSHVRHDGETSTASAPPAAEASARDGGGDGCDYSEAIARCERILSLVDTFCRSRHWMMHVGDEKGRILEEFLTKRLDTHGDRHKQGAGTGAAGCGGTSFWILEMGTYCGYSTLRMAKTCLEHRRRQRTQWNQTQTVHIVTVDVSPQFSRVAEQLVELAGLGRYIRVSFVLLPTGSGEVGSGKDHLTSNIARSMQSRESFDFCFLDHDKDMYLPDLLRLERARLVRSGTFVCADNIVFFRLDKYREHMSDLASQGVVATRLEMSRLEYVLDGSGEVFGGEDLRDGLELTEYLQDPPTPPN